MRDTVTQGQLGAAVRDLSKDPEALLAMGRKCLEIYGSDLAPGVDRVVAVVEEVSRARV